MHKKLFLSPPHMSNNEHKYIDEVFESNYIAPGGEFVDRFEASICNYTGTKNALAVTCGTAAIHLALRVLGIGKDDDVLASTFTFIGSVSPILYQHANPIFIDSERESWNLDPKLLKEYLKTATKRPKALILTHIYGQSAEIEQIASICREYGVYLIEDAAESLGATYGGKHTGTFGDFGIYSFNGNKIVTTSGGGMLVSDNAEWIAKAKFYSTQAKEDMLHYEYLEYGYNYRMSNLLAAIGVGQMEVIEERVEKKREIFEWYRDELKDLDVEWMPELAKSHGNRWLTTLLFRDGVNIDDIIDRLKLDGCESRPLWKPMHMQPLFKDSLSVSNGTSRDLFYRGLCLPSGTKMSREDVKRVCGLIRRSILEQE
ncbi:MAG: DegT/DnrJ/EryC1/StrS family aminotransferase [Campylobacterota bacterium]|nr:DegT/DnrJ/EryC1/StrS family aminotransferase [Campylobacterota bacterium]